MITTIKKQQLCKKKNKTFKLELAQKPNSSL